MFFSARNSKEAEEWSIKEEEEEKDKWKIDIKLIYHSEIYVTLTSQVSIGFSPRRNRSATILGII